jgi:hypothetical protein
MPCPSDDSGQCSVPFGSGCCRSLSCARRKTRDVRCCVNLCFSSFAFADLAGRSSTRAAGPCSGPFSAPRVPFLQSQYGIPSRPQAMSKPRLGGASNGCPVRLLIRTRSEAKGAFQRENCRPICFTIAPVKQIAISIAPKRTVHFASFASPAGTGLRQASRRKGFPQNCAREIRHSLKKCSCWLVGHGASEANDRATTGSYPLGQSFSLQGWVRGCSDYL